MSRERRTVKNLADAAAAAPASAGVYFVLGPARELLYAGKATNMRSRLRQHAAAVVPERTRLSRLYELATDVRWIECADADEAAAREADVIVALQPPFNASISDEGRWNFVVVDDDNGVARFGLSTTAPKHRRGRHVYGCFPHLGRGVSSRPAIACSDGYTALLRLLWATSATTAQMPARITRSAPDAFEVGLDASLLTPLARFLSGTSARLLDLLDDRADSELKMLAPALRRDRTLAHAFFLRGPRAIRDLRRRHGERGSALTRERFVHLVTADVRAAIA